MQFNPLTDLLPLVELARPRFPNLHELANQTPEQVSKKDTGLFSALVGDPLVLLDDVISHPSKYTPEAAELIQQLAHGSVKLEGLSRQDRDILDRATIDFAQPYREPKKEMAKVASAPVEEEDGPEIPDLPSTEGIEPFWWLR